MATAGVALQPALTPEPQAASAELVRQFAEAVAAPGEKALIYRPGGSNEAERFASLNEALHLAVTEGRAFAVRVRTEILAADFDKPESAGTALTLATELRAEGHQPVLIASGQPNRRHLFVRVPHPEQRAALLARLKASGADVRFGTQPIRPPLSPHRLGRTEGLSPKLLAPTDPTAALAALRGPESDERPRTVRPLSEATLRILAQSPPPGSRSEPVMSALLGMANAGLTRDEAWARLRAEPLGGRYAGPGHRPRIQFDREWSKACQRVEASPAYRDGADVRQRVSEYLCAVETAVFWRGVAGASSHAVLRAHAAIACRRGAMTYGASLRELAERAAVTLPTLRAANLRLKRMGLLTQARQGGVREGRRVASTWTLTLPNVATFSHSPLTPLRDLNGKTSLRSGLTVEGLLRHDVSRWGALGKGFPALILALETLGTVRVSSLAARLGRHRVTVSNQLRRLVALGLAERSPGERGFYRLSGEPETLAERLHRVAERLGTAGTGLRHQAAFEDQRQAFDAGRLGKPPRQQVGGMVFVIRPGGKPAPGRAEGREKHEELQERRVAARVRRRHGARTGPGRTAAGG